MRRTADTILKYAFLSVAMLFSASCVHEFPKDGYDPAEVVLDLSLTASKPILTRAASDGAVLGYVLEAYKEGATKIGVDKPELRIERFAASGDDELNLTLSAETYRFVAWMAYKDEDTGEAVCYDATDLAKVSLVNHIGHDDVRDAFRGELEIDLSRHEPGKHVKVSGTMTLKRPLAKVCFITEDVEQYAETYAHSRSGSPLDNLKAVFYYDGFMPVEYNCFTNQPTDSKPGQFYEVMLRDIVVKGKDTEIGFDYVFVNGEGSFVKMSVSIVDVETGQVLTSKKGLDIPVSRNHITQVRGNFLTEGSDTGISIETDFDGEFNIKF